MLGRRFSVSMQSVTMGSPTKGAPVSPIPTTILPEDYQRARARARRRPAWWLRLRQRWAGPAERAAIRRELITRSTMAWWVA